MKRTENLLIDKILKDQSRSEIAKEVKRTNRYNKTRHVSKEDTSKPSLKNSFFVDETNQKN